MNKREYQTESELTEGQLETLRGLCRGFGRQEIKKETEKKVKELTELLRERGFFEGKFVMLCYDAHKGFFVPAKAPLPRAPPIHPSCRCAIDLKEDKKKWDAK